MLTYLSLRALKTCVIVRYCKVRSHSALHCTDVKVFPQLWSGEKRGITPDTAMRLARYFGGDARSWLNLQTAYDLRMAEITSANDIARSVAPMKKAS